MLISKLMEILSFESANQKINTITWGPLMKLTLMMVGAINLLYERWAMQPTIIIKKFI